MKNEYDYELMISNFLLNIFKILALIVLNGLPVLLMFIPYKELTIVYFLLGALGFFLTALCEIILFFVDFREGHLTTLPFWQLINWIYFPYLLWKYLKDKFLVAREKYKL